MRLKSLQAEVTSVSPGVTQAVVEEHCASPEEKTLEVASPSQSVTGSAGHTPYYQSPTDEKASHLPSEATEKPQAVPVSFEFSEEAKDENERASISPMDEPVPDSESPIEKVLSPLRSPPLIGTESAYEDFLSADGMALGRGTESPFEGKNGKQGESPVSEVTSTDLYQDEQEEKNTGFIPIKEDFGLEKKASDVEIMSSQSALALDERKLGGDVSPTQIDVSQFGSFKKTPRCPFQKALSQTNQPLPWMRVWQKILILT